MALWLERGWGWDALFGLGRNWFWCSWCLLWFRQKVILYAEKNTGEKTRAVEPILQKIGCLVLRD